MASFEDFGTPDVGEPQTATTPTEAPTSPTIQAHVDALIQHESGGDPNAVGDSGLAVGLGQMHPEVRQAYGVRPDSTADEQRTAVQRYFTDLWNKHQGNADDALSEYHLGATNYARDRNSPDNLTYLKGHRKHLGAGGQLTFESLGTPEAPSAQQPAIQPPQPVTAPTQPSADPLAQAAAAVAETKPSAEPPRTIGEIAEARVPGLQGLTDLAKLVGHLSGVRPMPHDEWREMAQRGGYQFEHPVRTAIGGVGQVLGSALAPGLTGAAVGAGAGTEAATGSKGWGDAMEIITALFGPTAAGKVSRLLTGSEAAAPTAAITTTTLPEAAAAEEATRVAQHAASRLEPSEEAARTAQEALNPPRPIPEAIPGPPKPPVSPAEAGTTAKASVKASADAIKRDIQEGAGGYDEISNAARNLAFQPGAEAEAELAKLRTLREQYGAEWNVDKSKWEGGLITGKTADTMDNVETALKSGAPMPYPLMEDFKRILDSTISKPGPGATPKESALYQWKGDFRNLMRGVLEKEDPALAAKFDTANARWASEYLPTEKYAAGLAKLEPEEAFAKVFGAGTSPKSAGMVNRALRTINTETRDPAERAAAIDNLQRGFRQWMIGKATKGGELDPQVLLKQYDKLDPGFRDALGDKSLNMFMEAVRTSQKEAARAAKYAKAATGVAKEAAESAKPAVAKPGMIARLGAEGLIVTAGGVIGEALGHPWIGMGIAHRVLPSAKLAEWLSKPAYTQLLARALRTPVNSPAAAVILGQLAEKGRALGVPDTPAEKAA